MGRRLVRTVGRRLPHLVAVVAMAVTSGCWLQIGAGGGHTRANPTETTLTAATVAGLHQVWSVDVGGTASEAIVSQGRVFTTWTNTNATGVQAVALADGARLWSHTLLGGVAGPGAIVLGTPVTLVGDQLWGGHLGAVDIAPGPGDHCAFGADILDPATGAGGGSGDFPSGAASANGIVARTLLHFTPPCPNGGSNFVLDVQVSPPGGPATQWRSAGFGITSGDLVPTVTGDRVLLTHGTTLDAYAATGCGAATCAPVWTFTSPTTAVSNAMAGPTGPIYVTAESSLLALDRATGAELWRAPLGADFSGGLALAGGTVYAVAGAIGGSPSLLAFAAGGCGAPTCAPQWTAALPGTGLRAPAVGGDVVYTSTTTGVHAFAAGGCGAATCPALTSVPLTSGGTLSVAQGHVVVASGSRLTALGLG
jgi:outer membrane protein assembly factor BamB